VGGVHDERLSADREQWSRWRPGNEGGGDELVRDVSLHLRQLDGIENVAESTAWRQVR
jgi:hypothetical protein